MPVNSIHWHFILLELYTQLVGIGRLDRDIL